MLIDPGVIVREWRAVAVLTVVVIVGKVVGVTLGAFLTGNGVRTSVQSGMSLAQIGEFSFIIAGLGMSLNATGEFLYAIAVAVSGITTLTTPWLIRASEPAALWVDRVLPRNLQTFGALYGSWIEALRTASRRRATTAPARRLVLLLGLDMVVLLALAIVFSVAPVAALLESRAGASPGVANALRIGLGLLLAAPFCIGIFGLARRLGETLAESVLPRSGDRKVDFADAPRRAFVVTLQLAIVLVVALPLLALTQLFLPARYLFLGLLAGILVLGIMFWKGATSLQGHVRAGSEMIVQALARQSRQGAADQGILAPLAQFLPGLGEPVAIEIDATCPAAGRTLADLNVRGLTGATVLAVTRGEQGMIPSAQEVIRPGDVLALTGTHEAIEAAKDLLLPPSRGERKVASAETPAEETQRAE
jgi:CPA2 family monovalent cation:H+ antiporter-2